MRCEFCDSPKGASKFTNPFNPTYGEPIVLCVVCARLNGTTGDTTQRDVLKAIVLLFHALEILPYNPDEEEEE